MGLSGNDGKITNPTLIFIVMLCNGYFVYSGDMNDWWDIQISSAGNYIHLLARRHDAVNCQLQYTNPTKLLHWTEVLQTRGLVPQNSSLRVGWTSLVSVEKLTLCTKECSVTFCYSLEVHFSVERWWECSHSILTAALGWRSYSKPPIYTGKKHTAHTDTAS
jgi:hypothetical protein